MIKVLIVEDDPMVAKFNAKYLESMLAFQVIGIARNVKEAWQYYHNQKIDLILLDVYLEQDRGIDMLVELRNKLNPVDIIMITAANDSETIQLALHHGVIDYLIKPFSYERFEKALNKYLLKYKTITKTDQLNQTDLDKIFLESTSKLSGDYMLPKGLTKRTLSLIIRHILDKNKHFSAAELAESTGVSRVSIRKYLNFLVDKEYLTMEISYQDRGRPLSTFHVRLSQLDMLKSFL